MATKKEQKHIYFYESSPDEFIMDNNGLEMTEMEFLNYLNDDGDLLLQNDITCYRIQKEKLEKFQIEISLKKI